MDSYGISLTSRYLPPLAGSRPGGRLTFLRAQESQQRRRAAQLGAVKLASRPAGAALKQPRRVRREGACQSWPLRPDGCAVVGGGAASLAAQLQP